MTAHAMQEDQAQCLEAGMNDYLSKPITPEALTQVLERWLPGAGAALAETRKASSVNQRLGRSSDLPVFDRQGMLRRLMNDEELATAVMDSFLEDIPKQIQALQDYLKTGDAPSVELQAHTIKGASANVGGEALRAVAWEMEQAAKSKDLESAERFMSELEKRWLDLKKAMQESLAG